MSVEQQILQLLTGQKTFDGVKWRVHDADGVEIADPAGVLWRGVHGALLWNVNAKKRSDIPDSIKWGIGPMVTPERKERVKTKRQRQNEALLILLH